MTPSRSDGKPIPRGIEVLVKKAAVDPDFKQLLLAKRAGAAREIGLELSPGEAALLGSVPAAHLDAIIAQTVVSPMTRAAFLGRAAAAMLAALAGVGIAEAGVPQAGVVSKGVSPVPPVAPYNLCEETSYKGEITHSLLDAAAFRNKLGQVGRANRFLAQAHAQAAKAWSDDPARKGVAFPLPLPQPVRCSRLAGFHDLDAGQAALRPKQDDDAKRDAEARKAEEARLAALSEAARADEAKRAELIKAAQKLLEDQLKSLMAEGAVPLAPMAPGGVRPDVPSAVTPPASFGGVRPDHP